MLSSALFRSTTLVGCCCSSSKRSFVKDVYKELNYVAPFSQEEKTLVVEKINSARSGDDLIVLGIPRGSAVQIAKHLASQGPLEVLEQLLDVRRFHPEILENVTRTVIRNNSLSGQQDGLGSHLPPNKYVRSRNPAAIRASLVKQITPEVSKERWEASETAMGLKFGLTNLSFACLDKSRSVVQWNSIPLFTNIASRSTFEHHLIYSMSVEVAKTLPKADLYFLEEGLGFTSNDPNLYPKLHHLIFQATLVALLNEGKDENRTFVLKPQVVNDLYGAKVGSDRVRLQNSLQHILADREDNMFRAKIDSETWNNFIVTKTKFVREQMSIALLLVVAVSHLME